MSIWKALPASVCLTISYLAAWNIGVDFGNDVGFCVGYSVGDQTGKMTVAENPFCRGAKLEGNELRYAIRSAYLYAIGDHVPPAPEMKGEGR